MAYPARNESLLPGSVARFWKGKRLFLTGASSGLGKAVVELLAPLGMRFGLISRREQELARLAEQLAGTGSQFWYRSVDVRQREAVYQAVQDFARQDGLDVVWANSGVAVRSSWRKWDWAEVETALDTNLKGAIYTLRAGLEILVPQGRGTLVATGSAASMRGLPGYGIYSLTKIGLHYYLESVAAELPFLRVCILHPGFVDTPINRDNPNRFWLMSAQRAARLMVSAVARGRRVYIFPWRMRLLYHFIHALPESVYLWLAGKMMGSSRRASVREAPDGSLERERVEAGREERPGGGNA